MGHKHSKNKKANNKLNHETGMKNSKNNTTSPLITAEKISLNKELHTMFQLIRNQRDIITFDDNQNKYSVRYDNSLNELSVEKKSESNPVAILSFSMETGDDDENTVHVKKSRELSDTDFLRLKNAVVRTITHWTSGNQAPVISQNTLSPASAGAIVLTYNAQQERQDKLIKQYRELQIKIKALTPSMSSGVQDIWIDNRVEKITIDNQFIQWRTTDEYQRYSRGLKVTFHEVPTFDNIPLPTEPDEKIVEGLDLTEAVRRMNRLHDTLQKKIHGHSVVNARPDIASSMTSHSASSQLNVDFSERFRRLLFKSVILMDQEEWRFFPCQDGLIQHTSAKNDSIPSVTFIFPGGESVHTWGYTGSGAYRHIEYSDKYVSHERVSLEEIPFRIQKALEAMMFEIEGMEMPEGFEIPQPRNAESSTMFLPNAVSAIYGAAPVINKISLADLTAVTNFTTAHTFAEKYGHLLKGPLQGLWPLIKECYGQNSENALAQLDQFGPWFDGGTQTIRHHLTSLTKIIKYQEQLSAKAARKPPGSLGGQVSVMSPRGFSESGLSALREQIQKKLKAAGGEQDIQDTRWVVLLQPYDDTALKASEELFVKHPETSLLIPLGANETGADEALSGWKWDRQGESLVPVPVSPPQGRLKLQLVGHGINSTEEGGVVFGDRSVTELENNFRKMLSGIAAGSVSHIDVTLVGCLLVDVRARETGLARRLADILLEEAMRIRVRPEQLKLTASQLYVRVMPGGRKAYWLAYEGKWVSKEQAIKEGITYKSVWLYDGRRMISEVQSDRFTILAEKLWSGFPFHEFSSGEQELLLRVLKREDIDALSTRSSEGEFLRGAIRTLPAEGITDGHKALGRALDAEGDSLAEVAQKAGIDPHDRAENNRAGGAIVNLMQRQGKDTDLRVDSHTRERLGLRARVLTVLQMSSNGVLTLGAAAAFCRIYAINRRLEEKTLGEDEKTALLAEKNVAIAELSVDLTQELSEFMSSKFGIQLTRLPAGAGNVPASPDLSLGRRLTQGLRLSGLSAASTVLTAVGTAFAWYGVITAAKELQKLEKSAAAPTAEMQAKIRQLQVNIGVNIVTALVSTALTVGTVVSLVAGMASSLGIAGAAGVAVVASAFMSIAGPVGGAILVAAFVGLWVYNGIKTVEEFSRHIDLNGWDKFLLGFGSIFGYVSTHLQIKYDAEKLQSAVKRAAGLEKSGLLESLPEVRALYQFRAEVIPGREIEHRRETTGWFDGQEFLTTEVSHRESIPARADYPVIDINPDKGWYLSASPSDSSNQKQLRPDDFMHVRQGREEVTSEKGYQQGAFLTVQGRQIELPNSAFGQNNQSLDSAAVSARLNAALPQALKDILSSQPQSRLYAADEATHLALFCIHEQDKKISFFKFNPPGHPPGAGNRYALEFSYTQDLPAGPGLKTAAAVLFHDLDGNGLADLVVIQEDGSLQTVLQKRNGNFVQTQDFSLYRVDDGETLSFPWYDGIHGFGGTARTLYSHSSGGTRYSHVILSLAERKAMVSLVNLNRGTGEADGSFDNFIAPAAAQAGSFLFHLGGGREKRVRGGAGNDIFVLLDEKTLCKLQGNGGSDTLDCSRLSEKTVSGVRADMDDQQGRVALKRADGRTEVRVFFSGIRNITGARGDDELTGDNNSNVLDGVSGRDVISAGAGDDVLRSAGGGSVLNGGSGVDRYDLRRLLSGSSDVTELIEDYRLGEDSHVSLDYRIDEIQGITPEDGRHLLITLTGERKYRLKDFYANSHAGRDRKTSAFEFITQDGFRFRLETAATAGSLSGLTGIAVFFQGIAGQEPVRVDIIAGGEKRGVVTEERVAGQSVERRMSLPAMFVPELRAFAGSGVTRMTGHSGAERLTGGAGSRMTGNGGADVYVIDDEPGGIAEISNEDSARLPATDSLILPWGLSETALSTDGSDVVLSHKQAGHVSVRLLRFMAGAQFRHLMLHEPLGVRYRLDVTEGKVWLASSPLRMDREDRLELPAASGGGLTLDGRSRRLSGDNPLSTVIIDRSGRGNWLAGTENARNNLQVTGGRNSLYGGRLADTLKGGSGYDSLSGGDGDDVYEVSGSATLDDTGGTDTLILTGTAGTAGEELLLSRAESSLRIGFRRDNSREVIISDYFNENTDKKIEHLVMNDESTPIASLIDSIASLPLPTAINRQGNERASEVLSRWAPLGTSPAR